MKIWLSKNSEISVREQIVSQISLGIVSRDLKAGEKLPSTRHLARRFEIHQNTVSAAYRELAELNLVKFKKGSGVYVHRSENGRSNESVLDQIITRFFQETAAHNFKPDEIKARLEKRWAEKSPTHFLVVESDLELRCILIEEIREMTNCRAEGISFAEFAKNPAKSDVQIVAMHYEASKLQAILPPNKSSIFLKTNSVADSMTDKTRPSSSDLVAVVSRWEKFLALAKMFLLAVRIEPEALIVRSAKAPDWKNGLQQVSLIICDSVTAKEFPGDKRARVFKLIADSSLADLQKLTD